MQEALVGRERSVAGRRCPGQPARVARHGGRPPPRRPGPQRHRATASRGDRGGDGAGRRTRRAGGGRRPTAGRSRRHSDVAGVVLSSVVVPADAGGTDAARGRRPDDGRDRAGLFRSRRRRWRSASAGPSRRIKRAGGRFEMPAEPELTDRLRVVLQVLYLIFNEGYTASSGPGARPGRPDPRGDPPDPGRTRAAARRRRSRRAARADDPDRGAAAGTDRPGRRTRPARGAGSDALGCRRDPGRAGPRGRHPAARAGRAVPGAGGHRRGPLPRRPARATPTGHRSFRCTTC